LGESAATLQVSNLKNTVASLKRLVGRPSSDPTLEKEVPYTSCPLISAPTGEIGAQVNYLEEEKTFSATQLAAMYLSKLKLITEHEVSIPVTDVVVSVPLWFAPAQRKAMVEACEIAGLNPLRIINDTTAAALAYGITKTDLPEGTEPRKVIFVDMGHSSTQLAAVSFVKGKLEVKSTACDAYMGGRDLDQLLVNHFVEEFKGKYKFDLNQFPKPLFRLRAAIEKLKKVLSANSQGVLNIEALHDDRDVSSMITRDEFENYATPFISRIAPLLDQVLEKAGWNKDEVFCVETVGGTTRVPAVRDAITKYFGRELLSFTINQDEAVARGCALMCAIISPSFKVREFDIKDVAGYTVNVNWTQTALDGTIEKSMQPYKIGDPVPSTKLLTCHQAAGEPLDIETTMDTAVPSAATVSPFLGRYTIKKIPSPAADSKELTTVKVRLRMHPDHMVTVEQAYALVEDDSPPPPPPAPTTAPEGAAPAEPSSESPVAAAPEEAPKKVFKKVELSVIHGDLGMPKHIVSSLREEEGRMAASDRLVFDTEVAKNALEEYIYEARAKKDTDWSDFITEDDKSTLSNLLNESEDWLYSEEGEDSSKSVYLGKLDLLKAIGAPALDRVREHSERPRAAEALYNSLNTFIARLDDPSNAWLPEKERQSVRDTLVTKKAWADEHIKKQIQAPKHAYPLIVTCEQLNREKVEADRLALPLLNRPKPAPPKPEEPMNPEGAEATPAEGEATSAEPPKADETMSVD
jgi:heat shock protein 4